jgi:hypothetical protein
VPSLPQDDKACKAPTPIPVGAGFRRYCPNKSAEGGGFEMIEDVMSGYRFKVGQTVSYIPHFGAGAAKSTYKIIQLLPPEGGDFRYRIKSADEAHERVAKESQLDRST